MLLAINSQEDSLKLRADLQRLEVWERDWDMSFNPDKCEVLRISRKRAGHPFQLHLSRDCSEDCD